MEENTFELSEEGRRDILSRVTQANTLENSDELGMTIEYDAEVDFLHIGLGEPREALAITLADPIESVLLYDPETFEVVGLEVPFFMERRNRGQAAGDFWDLVVHYIDRHGPAIYIASKQETAIAGRAFRDLVSA